MVTAGAAERILDAARWSSVAVGFGRLSTRQIADGANVLLNQIHYHAGSRRRLILPLLDRENAGLLDRGLISPLLQARVPPSCRPGRTDRASRRQGARKKGG